MESSGGVVGLAGGMALVADVLRLARLPRCRAALRAVGRESAQQVMVTSLLTSA